MKKYYAEKNDALEMILFERGEMSIAKKKGAIEGNTTRKEIAFRVTLKNSYMNDYAHTPKTPQYKIDMETFAVMLNRNK